MPVTKISRTFWILILVIMIIGIRFAGKLSASDDAGSPAGWEEVGPGSASGGGISSSSEDSRVPNVAVDSSGKVFVAWHAATKTPIPSATPSFTQTSTLLPISLLPVIVYQLPPTPTPTSTPTSMPTPRGMIANGDFEKGRSGDWLVASQNGWAIIVDDLPSGVVAHSGRWLAWLGGDNDEVAGILQTVSIIEERATLTYWIWIDSQDICWEDVGGVVIDDGSEDEVVDAYYLCTSSNTNGWVRRTLNLEKYAGQTVDLYIIAGTDLSLPSSLFVDDVSLGESLHANENPSPNNLATGQPEALVKELLLKLRSQ